MAWRLGNFIIGVLNGALASGTGLFVTLWLIRWFGLDYKQAVAYTMILVGLFWNGSGALAVNALSPPMELAARTYFRLPARRLRGHSYRHFKGNAFIKKCLKYSRWQAALLLWNAWAHHLPT